MAWSPYNISSNDSSMPSYRQNGRDLNYRYGSVAHQYPSSLAAEPSMFTDNHLLYNTVMQHPSEPVHPSSLMPSSSAHVDSNSPNNNTIHNSSAGNDIPRESSAIDHLNSRHGTTTPSASGASTPSRELGGTYQCNWKDCKYRGKFSRKGVLMRHIETQHVSPRSFDCPVCGKLFCRRDNMTKHLGRAHSERV